MTTAHARRTALSTFLALSLTAGLLMPGVARADEKQACSDAFVQAQVSRDDHKLVRARQQLRVCARAECPGVIVKECARWLTDLESAMPSVVVTLKDARGVDVTDATVSMDGAVIASSIDGRSIDVDPGSHTFSAVTRDGQKRERTLLVREGGKQQQVSFTLGEDGGASPASTSNPGASNPGASNSGASNQGPGSGAVDASSPHAASSGAGRTAGFVVAGAGALALIVGGAFGVEAIVQNNGAGCDAQSVCKSPQLRRDAQGYATVSTVGFIAGGALVAGGFAIVLIAAPSPSPSPSALAAEV